MPPLPDSPQLDRVRALTAAHADLPGPLLPLLHAVQDELGHIPPDAVPAIARGLNLSRAEVHGVISYYHHFRSAPPGRCVVQVCAAEACQSRGGLALLQAARAQLPADVTVEAVYCLGLCAQSPAVMVDEQPHARMTPERLVQLVAPIEQVAP